MIDPPPPHTDMSDDHRRIENETYSFQNKPSAWEFIVAISVVCFLLFLLVCFVIWVKGRNNRATAEYEAKMSALPKEGSKVIFEDTGGVATVVKAVDWVRFDNQRQLPLRYLIRIKHASGYSELIVNAVELSPLRENAK